ncbi:MAG: hypothetical protein JXR37_12040 [Kiritimatiellae bacterium]|nr:hypothetical protein [Kiritimatiellia bacterium]
MSGRTIGCWVAGALPAAALFFAAAPETEAQMMWFQSGFEPDCRIVKNDPDLKHGSLQGKDLHLPGKNDWQADFGGYPAIKSGKMGIACRGTGFDKRNAEIVDDPAGVGQGKVLMFSAKYPLERITKGPMAGGYKTRVTSNAACTLMELYTKRKILIAGHMAVLKDYPKTFSWLMVEEMWMGDGWKQDVKYPFRIGINLSKAAGAGQELYFRVSAEKRGPISGDKGVWAKQDRDTFPIPFGEWFTYETYYKHGNDTTGRFYFAVTYKGKKTVLCDVANWTYHPDTPAGEPPNPITTWQPFKLYTSSAVTDYAREHGQGIQWYWDDFEAWDSWPPGAQPGAEN